MKLPVLKDGLIKMILLFFGHLLLVQRSQSIKYYCEENSSLVNISGTTTGTIITLYHGDSFYRNNQKCQWLIDAGRDGARIQLTVERSELEWSPEGAICMDLYDFVDVRDGNSTSSKSIAVWCGYRSPRSVISTGRYLYITFKSDPRNHYKYDGVILTFDIFNSTDCPGLYSSPGNEFCYSLISDRKVNWFTAQEYCNYDQANLVSIHADLEVSFLKGLESGNGEGWIGLNKIVIDDHFAWIDNTVFNYKNFDPDVGVNVDDDCEVFDVDTGLWRGSDCLRNKANFFCKMNKGKYTVLYNTPERKKPKESDPKPENVIVVAVVVPVVILLVVIVVVVVYLKFRRKSSQTETSRRAAYTTSQNDDVHHDDDDHHHHAVGSKNEPRTSVFTSGYSERNNFGRISSAPPGEGNIQHVAPPTYEEALNHPVLDV